MTETDVVVLFSLMVIVGIFGMCCAVVVAIDILQACIRLFRRPRR